MGRKPNPPRGLAAVRLDHAQAEYERYVRSRIPADSSTRSVKRSIVNTVVLHLGGARDVWTLTEADLSDALTALMNGADEAEQEYRRANGMRPRPGRNSRGSQSQARTNLRQFVEFCHRHQWLPRSVDVPQGEIVTAAKDAESAATPKFRFPEERWPEVLAVAGRRHMRTRMAVAIGLFCGRRVSEHVRLQWRHIDFQRQVIEFSIKKGGHTLLLPLFPEMRAELELWQEWVRATYGEPQDDWYLVPARAQMRGSGSRIQLAQDSGIYPVEMSRQSSTESVIKDVRKVLGEFGIEKHTGSGTHTLRRSAARVVALKHGLPIAKALLNHRNITTTETYVGADQDFESLWEKMMPTPDGGSPATVESVPDNVVPIRPRLAS